MITRSDFFRLLARTYSQLDRDQSLSWLSKRFGWSKFHTHREFQRLLGETPKGHIQRLRLERAAAMLTASAESVRSVAFTNGFRSHEVFCRAFRRKFGNTPTEYRSVALAGRSANERARHQELITSVGPCVHLFRTNSMKQKRTSEMSELSISRKEIEAKPILYIQRRVAQTQLQPLFAECFPMLFGHCIAAGIAIGGQPVARYVEMTSGLWTVDCAIPLQNEAEPSGEMQFGYLQSGPVATAVHVGAYEGLPETNAAIQMWIEKNDYQVNGPSWESYVTSPTEHPDVNDWRTEVFWPLAE